jgi:hypothetical protein
MLTGVGYLIMNRYNSDKSVYTVMKNKASYNRKMEDTSVWQVITDMGPVLTYNTYNKCYGRFTDPEDLDLTPGRYDDESGKGFQGDYEFVMVEVPENGDHVLLKGKKRNVYQRLTRLPEGTDFEAYLDDIAKFNADFFVDKLPYEFVLIDNGVKYQLDKMNTFRPIFYPQGKDSVSFGRYLPYLVTKYNDQYHLRFKDSIMLDNNVQMEQEFAYNATEDVFYGKTNSANTITPAYASALDFFKPKYEESHLFKLYRENTKSDMSEKMQAAFDAASNAMNQRNKKYRIDSLALYLNTDKEHIWQLRYLSGKAGDDIRYKYTSQFDGNAITFTFQDAEAQNGRNIMNSVPEIKTLMTEVLSQRFRIEKYITRFNLTKIKLVSETDSDIWFVINY